MGLRRTLYFILLILCLIHIYIVISSLSSYADMIGGGSSLTVGGSAVSDPNLVTTGDVDPSVSGSNIRLDIDDNGVDGTEIAIGSDAQGDMLYYDGTDYVRLPKGTAGQVLEMNAGATAPEWDTDDGAAGGDSITVDGAAVVDPDFGDTGPINFITAGNKIWASIDANGVDISDSTNLTAGDALTLTGDDIDFDGGTAPGGELGGTWGTPTIDDSLSVADWLFTSSVSLPNAAGDVVVNAAGEAAIDSTNEQFVVYDGANEAVIPLRHIMQGTFDLTSQWDVDSDLWLVDLHADTFPNGITITKVTVDCTVADPTTELNANLMYCDAVGGGAFPGANAVQIEQLDTTTGNFDDDQGDTAVATGKSIFIDLDADPTDANVQWHVKIHYRIEED